MNRMDHMDRRAAHIRAYSNGARRPDRVTAADPGPWWHGYARRALTAALVYAFGVMVATESPLAILAVVLLAVCLLDPSQTAWPATRPVARRRQARRPPRNIADHRHVLMHPLIVVSCERRPPRIVRAVKPLPPHTSARPNGSHRRPPRLVRRHG